jgi:S-DNA-T family DNA segregation ATPase FtsK/SpoIIIE
MIEIFEREGVVGPANGSKPRAVIITSFQSK